MASVLQITAFAFLPPRGGGALRCFHLMNQLCRHHDLELVSVQSEANLRNGRRGEYVPDQVRIRSPLDSPPPRMWTARFAPRLTAAIKYRWLRRSLRGPANSTLLKTHHLIREALLDRRFDAVVFEELDALCAAPLVRRLAPQAIRIVNMYNVNANLLRQETDANPSQIARLEKVEASLDTVADEIWACSEEDAAVFRRNNRIPVQVIPNGADACRLRPGAWPAADAPRRMLFCGSLRYPPNADGLAWFADSVWPAVKQRLPDVLLTIVGRDGSPEDFPTLGDDPQVEFKGEVQDVVPYYHAAHIAICPLRRGSGTRLKILEAMALGRPVVSTSMGAEGLDVVSGEHVLLADDPHDFVDAIVKLLRNVKERDMLAARARKRIEETYDWAQIGKQAAMRISERAGRAK